MFHTIKLKKIDFVSNPPLEARPASIIDVNQYGDPVTKFVYQERSNEPFLQGAHYDPSVMSLRAKLGRGVELQKVSYDQLENDPNKLQAQAEQFADAVVSRSKSRTVAPVSEPSNSQIVESSNPS